jgi:hypothetical protein
MKKILAIFFLLVLAAFCSVQPSVKSQSTASAPAANAAIADCATGVEEAMAVRRLTLHIEGNCPDGYYDCDGCCVPYKCITDPNGPGT